MAEYKSKLVTCRLSQIQADYLDEMVRKGYGADRVEVLEYLAQRAFDDLLRTHVLSQ